MNMQTGQMESTINIKLVFGCGESNSFAVKATCPSLYKWWRTAKTTHKWNHLFFLSFGRDRNSPFLPLGHLLVTSSLFFSFFSFLQAQLVLLQLKGNFLLKRMTTGFLMKLNVEV